MNRNHCRLVILSGNTANKFAMNVIYQFIPAVLFFSSFFSFSIEERKYESQSD